MIILENKTSYDPIELIGIAERENNTKRRYLYVNRLQAKHVPVSPHKMIDLSQALGRELYADFQKKTVTFIGFAETATAIGAAIAADFPGKAYYLQTTREHISSEFAVVDFQEEHSHATEQLLFCKEQAEILEQSDQIIFVEDEITTGKTILNFIHALKQKGYGNRFCAASFVNSMTGEQMQKYQQEGIGIYYLIKLANDADGITFTKSKSIQCNTQVKMNVGTAKQYEIKGRKEPRTGLLAQEYQNGCKDLANEVLQILGDQETSGRRILVMGTEECMYPAIYTGYTVENKYPEAEVRTHATTRSPICPRKELGYPLNSRFALESLYEAERKSFLYNVENYDIAVIITDALKVNKKGLQDLLDALYHCGNATIILVRWVEA